MKPVRAPHRSQPALFLEAKRGHYSIPSSPELNGLNAVNGSCFCGNHNRHIDLVSQWRDLHRAHTGVM